MDKERFALEIAAFEAQDRARPPASGAVLFTGSSSITRWNKRLKREMAPLRGVVGRGFGGSTMPDLLHYFDRIVLPHRPRAVVVYEGDNDLAHGSGSPDRVLADFERFFRRLHRALPAARVYVLSIKYAPRRRALWPLMREVNERLAARCARDPRLLFVEVSSVLCGPRGGPRRGVYAEDRLHLSPAGYVAWRAVLRPILLARERG